MSQTVSGTGHHQVWFGDPRRRSFSQFHQKGCVLCIRSDSVYHPPLSITPCGIPCSDLSCGHFGISILILFFVCSFFPLLITVASLAHAYFLLTRCCSPLTYNSSPQHTSLNTCSVYSILSHPHPPRYQSARVPSPRVSVLSIDLTEAFRFVVVVQRLPNRHKDDRRGTLTTTTNADFLTYQYLSPFASHFIKLPSPFPLPRYHQHI